MIKDPTHLTVPDMCLFLTLIIEMGHSLPHSLKRRLEQSDTHIYCGPLGHDCAVW